MLELNVVQDLVTVYPVLHGLPAPLQRALVQHAAYLEVVAGDVLFDVHSPCRHFPFVLSGAVRVVRPMSSGRELLLYRVEPGESCILTVGCMLGATRYHARGLAEPGLTVVGIAGALFDRLVSESPDFRRFVFHFFGQRLVELVQLIDDVGFRQLDQRLASLLLARGQHVHTTHSLLAGELGTVREVVSRILKQFADQELVHLGRGEIEILDRAGLQALAGSNGDSSH